MQSSPDDSIVLNQSEFQCAICLDIAENVVETRCCHQLYCERCVVPLLECPTCRARPLQTVPNTVVRRLIGKLPAKCTFCGASFERGNMANHTDKCPQKPFKCPGCPFECPISNFLAHLTTAHPDILLKNCPRLFAAERSPPVEPPAGDRCPLAALPDPLRATHNSRGVRVHIGETGKYYCGQRVLNCDCCEGHCGPNSGCNCAQCMELDVCARRLPRGYLVNSEGAVAKREANGHFYCYRLLQGCVCRPQESSCPRCQKLDNTLVRYRQLL